MVARAVLEAVRDSYPAANSGGILLFDATTGKLRSLSVALHDGGVIDMGPTAFELAPGEAIAGTVYLTGKAEAWRSKDEISRAHAGLQGTQADQIRTTAGVVKSAAAAPLHTPDRGVIGVLTLGSSVREGVFSPDDVTIVQGLADQAALGFERARCSRNSAPRPSPTPSPGWPTTGRWSRC